MKRITKKEQKDLFNLLHSYNIILSRNNNYYWLSITSCNWVFKDKKTIQYDTFICCKNQKEVYDYLIKDLNFSYILNLFEKEGFIK